MSYQCDLDTPVPDIAREAREEAASYPPDTHSYQRLMFLAETIDQLYESLRLWRKKARGR